MKNVRFSVSAFVLSMLLGFPGFSQKPDFSVIAFYTTTVERDHVEFAHDAIKFFNELAPKNHFAFDTTSNWANLNEEFLRPYQVVVWLNEFPHTQEQRLAFENYMNRGGAWLGFHVSAYNDKSTHWPWFVDFLGGAIFHSNNWPPLAAQLIVDNQKHPVTRDLPATFRSPITEWYHWEPSPRLSKDIMVLVTMDPSNYPLGKKDFITGGDTPVVWTNTRYKMVYMNMGHGDKVMTDALQNKMFSNAIMWLGEK